MCYSYTRNFIFEGEQEDQNLLRLISLVGHVKFLACGSGFDFGRLDTHLTHIETSVLKSCIKLCINFGHLVGSNLVNCEPNNGRREYC